MNSIVLERAFEKIKCYLAENQDDSTPVVKYRMPSQLNDEIDLKINEKGVSEHQFLDLMNQYLDFSVRTGSKKFLNQLFGGQNLPAIIGEFVSTISNTSMYTYEVAPVATAIETEMIATMNKYVGYEEGDGIFLSGGSNANLIAMFTARNQFIKDVRINGYDGQERLVAFVNEQSHYSFETAANILGIGSKNVIQVKSDSKGRLIPEELEKEIILAIKRGQKPFFVAATCGTTLLAAFDPIDRMAEICKKYRIWFHADGSYGGSALLSEKHSYLLNGLSKTDSFAWNPHKLMNIPLVCSTLLLKKRDLLQANITDIHTDYIYHDREEIEDLGKKSIQCGRRVDAVKLWFAWKYYGLEGYRKKIDNIFDMAMYAEKYIIEHPRLELLSERQSFALCFRYLPGQHDNINEFNLELRERLRISGQSIVNYSHIGEILTLRLVTINSDLNILDIDKFFNSLLIEAFNLEHQKVQKDNFSMVG